MADRYFSYGERELAYLRKKDKKLAAVIDQWGMYAVRSFPICSRRW